jgi:hypothetical protein
MGMLGVAAFFSSGKALADVGPPVEITMPGDIKPATCTVSVLADFDDDGDIDLNDFESLFALLTAGR